MTVGDVGRELFSVYRRAVTTWARGGFNVMVDEVAYDREAVMDWPVALGDLRTTWVGIRCDPDVAAERERLRGDRQIGLARGMSAMVHEHATYDFELDTSEATPEQLVAELAAYIAMTPGSVYGSPSGATV